MSERVINKEALKSPVGKWFRDILAPGTARVGKFAIPVKLAPQKNGIRVDMGGFKDSKQVQAQLKAAAKIKLDAGPGEKKYQKTVFE